jgi:metal-responsive CopG/Arc/MetJ family transcriptional regulator
LIALRLSAEDIATVDERARRDAVNRSEMIRRMVAYALGHMPQGWRP